jgi:hypothetical protein
VACGKAAAYVDLHTARPAIGIHDFLAAGFIAAQAGGVLLTSEVLKLDPCRQLGDGSRHSSRVPRGSLSDSFSLCCREEYP